MTSAWFLVLLLAEVALCPLSCGVGPWGVPELPWSWDHGCTWWCLLLNPLVEFRLVVQPPLPGCSVGGVNSGVLSCSLTLSLLGEKISERE